MVWVAGVQEEGQKDQARVHPDKIASHTYRKQVEAIEAKRPRRYLS